MDEDKDLPGPTQLHLFQPVNNLVEIEHEMCAI